MRRLLLMLLFGVGLAVLPQAVASAADFTVNSNADQTDAVPGNGTCATAGGVCTLRAAVVEAEGLLGADTITVPAMTISLGSQLSITKTVTISGAGARSTIITGTPGHVLVGVSGGDVTLRDLALQDGSATGGGGLGVYQTGPAATQLIRVRVSGHSVNSPLGSVYAPVVRFGGGHVDRGINDLGKHDQVGRRRLRRCRLRVRRLDQGVDRELHHLQQHVHQHGRRGLKSTAAESCRRRART